MFANELACGDEYSDGNPLRKVKSIRIMTKNYL